MITLVKTFLKIFFRNKQAVFFVILLPAGLLLILMTLGLEGIVRYDLPISYAAFLVTGIIAMALMQTGIYTVAYSLIGYRRTHILKRLSITPLSAGRFLYAQTLARFLIACLQVLVLLLLGYVLFGFRLQNLIFLPILIFFGSCIFLNLGFLIASYAKDYEEAAPYTALIGLPLVFLGDVFFPTANLPPALTSLSQFLPLAPLSQVLRHFFLETPSPDLLEELLVLLVWLVLSTAISYYLFQKKAYH